MIGGRLAAAFASFLVLCGSARAQSVGGNVSIAATSSSANIQLPKAVNPNSQGSFPALLLVPAQGAASEIFYKLGTSNSVVAVAPSLPITQGSPAVPPNGVCVMAGPNTWIAAVSSGTATLRVTQMSQCPR